MVLQIVDGFYKQASERWFARIADFSCEVSQEEPDPRPAKSHSQRGQKTRRDNQLQESNAASTKPLPVVLKNHFSGQSFQGLHKDHFSEQS